jgi:hypothetical protein
VVILPSVSVKLAVPQVVEKVIAIVPVLLPVSTDEIEPLVGKQQVLSP